MSKYEIVNKENFAIHIVEDGSVDTDKLKEDGFYCIVYRSGATPPQILK